MRHLGIEAYNKAEYNSVLATGVVTEPMLNERAVRWVAIKGYGNDWSIYYHFEDRSLAYIRNQGDKVTSANIIQNLVPCSEKVLSLYRL